jgi:uncharacterized protein (DUF427 family)
MAREVKTPGPDHPIAIDRNPNRLVVQVDGVVIADTTSALTMNEAAYPPVHYIPLTDVDTARLRRTESHTYCPYKGEASYYTIVTPARDITDAVWTYDEPYTAVDAIAGHVAFYQEQVQLTVD